LAAHPEHLDHVPELAVDVPADGDGRPDGLYVGLLDEDGSDDLAEVLELGLGQVFAGPQFADRMVWCNTL
jgi:hypothetical protein